MANTFRFETDADGIVTLTLDVPGSSVNLMSSEFMRELGEAADRIRSDNAIKGVVLTSAKRDFMAGADLKDLKAYQDRGITAAEAAAMSHDFNRIYRSLETCGKPVAAAINGLALGGGLELALACHYRVIADAPKVQIGLPEVKVGLLPGAGGTQRLPRLIGITNALPLMVEGKLLKPAEALKLGIVHEVAAPEQIVARARAWLATNPEPVPAWDKKGFKLPGGAGQQNPGVAQTFMIGNALVAKNTFHNYPAPNAILSAVYEGSQLPIDRALAIESKYFGKLLSGAVARNLIRTMFINKGRADSLARRPKDVEKSRVTRLGMLGAGMMGAGIAYSAAMVGIDVVLLDTSLEAAEKGKGYSRKLLDKAVQRGKSSQEQADVVLARIHPTTDYADLAGCELVVEAVFEQRDIKADVTARAEAVLPKTAVFASNTSTLPITGLAQASKRPAQFIGLHFFSPVDKMPLVEVIMGKRTSQEVLARALDFVAQLKKTPIVVNDSRGFYTSRVISTYNNEGMAMLAEGVEPALIENAAKMAGYPVGPLNILDEVTIELAWKITLQTEKDLGSRFVRPVGYPVMAKMVELGRLGKRQGAGFYDYPADAPKRLWPGLGAQWPAAEKQPPVEELIKRFLSIEALESVRCMDEKVITDPVDADLGSILGIGYPAWTGGALSYIETVGIQQFVSDCKRFAKLHGERFRPTRSLQKMAREGGRFYPVPATGDAA